MYDFDSTSSELQSEHDDETDSLESPAATPFARQSEVFDEAEEMELAAELLGVSDEAELDQFLGGLLKQAGQALKKVIASPLAHKLGGFLKGAVKKALPAVAGAAGTVLGGPLGGMIGSKLGSATADVFGLELEGLSPEDQEFETARQVVRFAGEAVKQAVNAANAASTDNPHEAARQAVMKAAQKLAPGLLRPNTERSGVEDVDPRAKTGRWARQGRNIVLFGI